MNAERLLTHYHRIADAPDAIVRLRRFILDLALRGKLVPQDPNDEPASELLKRIGKEKARLVKAGGIRKSKGEQSELGEPPFQLPPNWTWAAFGDVHNLIRGVTYSKSDVSEGRSDGYVPVLRANNIGSVLTHEEPVFVKRNCVSAEQFFRAGDFMIALSSGSKNLVGKAAFVPEDYQEAFGGFCGVIRLFDHALQGIVRVFLQSDLYRESISAGSRGIGINNLKKETLSNLFFPLSPLAEQHRIVAKVDELMALCDRLEAAQRNRESVRDRLAAVGLARLNAADPETFQADARFALYALPALTTRPDQIKQLRQTILSLAVSGKLEESGTLLDAKSKGASPGKVTCGAVDDAGTAEARLGTSVANRKTPSGWRCIQLGDVIESMTNGVYKPAPFYSDSGTACVRMYNIQNGALDLTKLQRLKLTDDEIQKYRLLADDLLVNRVNSRELVGKAAVVGRHSEPLVFEAMNIRLRIVTTVAYPPFVNLFLQTTYVRSIFESNAKQAVGQASISQPQIARLEIALPPLAEQNRIVAKVDALMALCDRLEANLTATASTRRRLLDALLAKALAPAEDRKLEAAE